MIKAVFFDLDGTLINTVADLGAAVDFVLKKYGLVPRYSEEDYKQMVGNGALVLLERAFSGLGYPLSGDEKKKALEAFKAQYSKCLFDQTALYDGIGNLLKWLGENGYKTAVITNKPDENARQMLKHYFASDAFAFIAGQREGVPIKPNPANVDFALAALHLYRDEVVYIGDSNTDIQTAKNAGIISIGAAWGFRGEEELRKEGADYIAQTPGDVIPILTSLQK